MQVKLYIVFLTISIYACNLKQNNSTEEKMGKSEPQANRLINESSPYLLQHAYNPVDWRAWNKESLSEAVKQNKPILISIGYSACHWCHVMEEESFEDSVVARIMNDNFICIKVDREERPDIDHLYMDAVQIMTGRGGWPLNCFALPDGRPFYGGTYFPKDQWVNILNQLSELYRKDSNKVIEYAEKLSSGIVEKELVEIMKVPSKFNAELIAASVEKWQKSFDHEDGGNNYAPKFPMPNNYEFLLQYIYFNPDQELENHLKLSLKKMAYGGIYDQIGGGFARYSTDMQWKAPHFEKMLYDNAQLISLYSKAYKKYKDPLYNHLVNQTIEFLEREMKDESGAFYSALDADSEGEEGKFYCWEIEEIKGLISPEEFEIAERYYNLNAKGKWEGKQILLRDKDNIELASELKINQEKLEATILEINEKLLKARENRVRPGLDDKVLTSWNALMVTALLDAYEAFGKEEYLKLSISTANFIVKNQMDENGTLFHSYKNGNSTINGFLEDYSFSIEAFIALYENTFDEKWLSYAKKLADQSIKHFYDSKSGYFYFNSDLDPKLISRKIEKNDNVIPSSNSSICKALYKLGNLLEDDGYLKISDQLLANSLKMIEQYVPYASNWGIQLLNRSKTFHEVAIMGDEALAKKKELMVQYLPNKIVLGNNSNSSTLALLENKWTNNETIIYVCQNKSCQKPVMEVSAAIEQLDLE